MSSLLLVDDNTQLLEFFKLVLTEAGHQVRTADNCPAAIHLLVEADPEIVIMDLHVPEMEDGLGLIRKLKNHQRPPGLRPLKVIVISGWTGDLLAAAENDWVDRVLPKPVRMEVLLRSISELALMLWLCLAAARPLAAETFCFSVKRPAPVVASLEMLSPGISGGGWV